MIDLHTHSTFSDGSLTPSELVGLAADSGVRSLALTDHDTTDGIPEFLAACERQADEGKVVDGVAGVELSVDSPHGTMHMLGYLMDAAHEPLRELLGRIRAGRDERNLKILDRLRELGHPLDWADVASFSDGGVVGRPHIARALVKSGTVSTTQRAFKRLLGNGRPAYCERYRPSAEEAIACVRSAGGVAVLAHPVTLKLTMTALRKLLVTLVDAGLQGIEAHYSEHSDSQESVFADMARDFRLVATGGSDFHGDLNPLISLGRGFGRLRVPEGTVEALRRAAGS